MGTEQHLQLGPGLEKCGGPQLPPESPGPRGVPAWVLGGDSTWEWSKLCVMPPAFSADEAWTEVIDTLTVAAIRFEMLSTAHRSQVGQEFMQSQGRQTVGTVERLCAEQPGL